MMLAKSTKNLHSIVWLTKIAKVGFKKTKDDHITIHSVCFGLIFNQKKNITKVVDATEVEHPSAVGLTQKHTENGPEVQDGAESESSLWSSERVAPMSQSFCPS